MIIGIEWWVVLLAVWSVLCLLWGLRRSSTPRKARHVMPAVHRVSDLWGYCHRYLADNEHVCTEICLEEWDGWTNWPGVSKKNPRKDVA